MASPLRTAGIPRGQRAARWSEIIAATYFPLDLGFPAPESFDGTLVAWELGPASLSRLTSDPLTYRRRRHHLVAETGEQYLVTLPAGAPVSFAQCGQDVCCLPGGFIIERSHEPYEFSYAEPNDLFVLKVPGSLLGERLRRPDRFCALEFDATTGVGAFFADMLRLVPKRLDAADAAMLDTVGRQLVDLLALAIGGDPRGLASHAPTVREAHNARIEAHIRQHLGDPDLSPERIARACGISTRYLHDLFRDAGRTVCGFVRETRLRAAEAALRQPANRRSIAEIAYTCGFSDQAQFARQFKSLFGLTPREVRAAAITRALAGRC